MVRVSALVPLLYLKIEWPFTRGTAVRMFEEVRIDVSYVDLRCLYYICFAGEF